MTEQEFAEGIYFLEIAYNKKYTAPQKQVMYLALKDLSYEKYEKCIKKVLQNHKYNILPNIADIYQYAVTTEDEKVILIAKVRSQIQKAVTKSYANVICDEPLTHKVIELLGGLSFLGTTTLENFNIILNTKVDNLVKSLCDVKFKELDIILGRSETGSLYLIGDNKKIKRWINRYIALNKEMVAPKKRTIQLLTENMMIEDKTLKLIDETRLKLLGGVQN